MEATMAQSTLRTAGAPHGPLRRSGGVALLLAFSLACGDGGGVAPDLPVETFPAFSADVAVSPTFAYWGTAGARFVISGGSDLLGRSFTVRLGSTECTSATADAADPSKLNVVCDLPHGGEVNALTFQVEYQGLIISGPRGRLVVTLDWPPAAGPASFDAASLAPTSHPTWWQRPARLEVTGGVNLPGHALTAVMDGVPCGAVAVSSRDPGTLELSCPTRPGGAGNTARLVIHEGGATVPVGELVLDLDECGDPPPPAVGVPVPQLCNTPPGTTAAASSGLEGIWESQDGMALALFAPDGRFMAVELPVDYWGGEWTVSGSTWTPSNAEHLHHPDFEPFTASGAFLPFTSVGPPADEGYLSANALAVSQAGGGGSVGVAGAWGKPEASLSLTVDAAGAFTGATTGAGYGACTLTGTITVIEPPRNMLSVAMTVSGGEACLLWQSSPLSGLGFVDLETTVTGSGQGHAYRLRLLTRSAGQYYLLTAAIRP
jgi:hypothetical protein